MSGKSIKLIDAKGIRIMKRQINKDFEACCKLYNSSVDLIDAVKSHEDNSCAFKEVLKVNGGVEAGARLLATYIVSTKFLGDLKEVALIHGESISKVNEDEYSGMRFSVKRLYNKNVKFNIYMIEMVKEVMSIIDELHDVLKKLSIETPR